MSAPSFDPSIVKAMEEEVNAEIRRESDKYGPVDGMSRVESIRSYLDKNEDGDAMLFMALFKNRFCYDHIAGKWYCWNSMYWEEDKGRQALSSVAEITATYMEGIDLISVNRLKALHDGNDKAADEHDKTIKKLYKRVQLIQTLKRKQNILTLAASGKDSLGITGDEWDHDPWLLACRNGVVDLRTGGLRPGRPEDYIKTVCPTEWQGIDATAPAWEKFLGDIFATPQLVEYVHRLLGSSIVGIVKDNVLPIFWGKGRNGKTTLFETLSAVLGDYAGPIQTETIMEGPKARSGAAPAPDLLALRGMRLVWASETQEGEELNSERVKKLTGGDRITGRGLYSNHVVSFVPSHKLLLLTNHKPKAKSDDYALWARINLVPFEFSFVDDPKVPHERKRDPDLLEKLQKEAPGILAWLVRGCLRWQEEGLNPPAAVIHATETYKKEEDSFGQFLGECCVLEPSAQVKAGSIQLAYTQWADESGVEKPLTKNELARKLLDRFMRDDSKRNRVYLGVRLKDA